MNPDRGCLRFGSIEKVSVPSSPEDVTPDPAPQEAYREAVFLGGFIREQQRRGTWSNDTLERFESFNSTTELEAIDNVLREIASRVER